MIWGKRQSVWTDGGAHPPGTRERVSADDSVIKKGGSYSSDSPIIIEPFPFCGPTGITKVAVPGILELAAHILVLPLKLFVDTERRVE